MKWYFEVLKRYVAFEGRATRSEYWWFTLINGLIVCGLSFLDIVFRSAPSEFKLFGALYLIYVLGTMLPGLGVTVRRLHDTDHSGWWLLIGFVPFFGVITLIVFTCLDSADGENRFGPNPKKLSSSAGGSTTALSSFVSNVLYALAAAAVLAALHLHINESVVGANLVLAVGLGGGILLSAILLAVVFASRGELALEIDGRRYSGLQFWFRASLVSLVLGATLVFAYNTNVKVTPTKVESWEVTYNGPRTLKHFDPIATWMYRRMNERILALTNGREQLIYSYLSDLPGNLSDAKCGTNVSVVLQMSELGIFRIEDVSLQQT